MKKIFAVLIIAIIAVSSVFASGVIAGINYPVVTMGPTVLEAPVEPVAPAPIVGMQKIVILNNAFDGLALSSQCYNAKEYHKCYNLGEIMDANLVFVPADDANADTVAFTDFYTDTTSVAEFREKYVSFVKDNPSFEWDIFVGPKQKETYDVKYKGYVLLGAEALVFIPMDGWNVAELFEYAKMYEAETYDLVTVDGSVYRVPADALEAFDLVMEDGVAMVTDGETTVENPLYVYPTFSGNVADVVLEEGIVYKMTVINDAKGVYGVEAPYSENRAGTFYDSWSAADLMAKFDVPVEGSVKEISWKDGYTVEDSAEHFASIYIAFQAPTKKGDQKDYFGLGRNLARNAGVNNVGYYVFSEAAFAYIPEAGLSVAEAFATVDMAETASYELTYADGKTESVAAADVLAMTLAADSKLVSIVAK